MGERRSKLCRYFVQLENLLIEPHLIDACTLLQVYCFICELTIKYFDRVVLCYLVE